ncbi:trypsin-like serine peptidase [Streptomyces sp. NPDC090025]|uniref:trypsin-like serine peptidase n=1 Tax=Streptomyces sp. NPDC090025 TaxID=3365922 RepID=UPI003833E3DB
MSPRPQGARRHARVPAGTVLAALVLAACATTPDVTAVPALDGPLSGKDRVTGEHIDGVPGVGAFFTLGRDISTHSCTGTVVHSPHGDTVITAAHCGIEPGRAAFVPGYDGERDAAHQPYGTWVVDKVWRDPRYRRGATHSPSADHDLMFVRLRPDRSGRPVEAVTGAQRLRRTPAYDNEDVSVIGYPSRREDPEDRPVKCQVTSTRLPGFRQLRMACGGYVSGVSGGPWLLGFDGTTGDVVGVTGGTDNGGPNDRVSYSPLIGDDALRLFDTATHDRGPAPA